VQNVLAFILGGGQGTRLYPLTKVRSEPAVPVAGKYRLIDIPISNCINSGINRVFVLTQYQSVSLHSHLANTYKFDPFGGGAVEVLAAHQTNEAADWYQGTADAVRQQIRYVQADSCNEVLILSGDQLYRMDFRTLLRSHRERQADVTLAVVPVEGDQASRLGVVRLDADGRITELIEKPLGGEQLERLRMTASDMPRFGLKDTRRCYMANMGIYLFRRQALIELLTAPPLCADFVRDIFPRCVAQHRIVAFPFPGYWEDLGTIRSYHAASLALASDDPPFDFHSPEGVIFTRMRFLPASRMNGAQVEQCVVSDGCVVEEGARLSHCVLGIRSRIGREVVMRDTVFNGADRFETDAERSANRARGHPDLGVGDGCLIERAILDKDCRIGRNVRIVNRRSVQDEDTGTYVIRDGIVVIPNGAVVPDETTI
jgi:glucose-1-phosphate adenylyltransferase